MHPTRSSCRPPRTGMPSTHLTRVRNFPHPARHAPTPGRPHMQAMPPAILTSRSHAQPPSFANLPIPHAMPPRPAALVCRPPTRPSSRHAPMPSHPRMQVMRPPIPHTTPTCPAALVCTPHARPSLMPHPDAQAARQPLIACHTSTHPSCESYLPSFTLHGAMLGLSLPNSMRFTFFLLLANLKVNPLLLVKHVFYMPISHHDRPSASTTACHKPKLLALLPNADQHPLSSSLIARSFSL